jgi:Flp pilus assembly protein TadB
MARVSSSPCPLPALLQRLAEQLRAGVHLRHALLNCTQHEPGTTATVLAAVARAWRPGVSLAEVLARQRKAWRGGELAALAIALEAAAEQPMQLAKALDWLAQRQWQRRGGSRP